jgi:hypothetical protein
MTNPVRIAIAVDEEGARVSGHAGQTRHWLLFDCVPGEQLPHHFKDDGPHPLHGSQFIVAGSAGDGFVRHMGKWGAQVLLTGESDPSAALRKILQGEALPDPRFDITTTLCKLRDLFSRH